MERPIRQCHELCLRADMQDKFMEMMSDSKSWKDDSDNGSSGKTKVMSVLHRVSQATIARGAFGEICLALQVPTTKGVMDGSSSFHLVAIKTVYLDRPLDSTPIQDDPLSKPVDEISCLKQLNPHPNIVNLLEVFSFGPSFGCCLVLPYCPMDLYTVLEWKRLAFHAPLTESTLYRIALHLFSALQHCHSQRIVHGDIKPGNLLICTESATLKLCDFGIAVKQRRDTSHNDDIINQDATHQRQPRALCTLQYRPPELLLGLLPTISADPSMDMFSAGITLGECIAGHSCLFPGTSALAQLSLYFSTLGTPTLQTWPGVAALPDWGKLSFVLHPQNPDWYQRAIPRLRQLSKPDHASPLADIVFNCIQLDPTKRWTANQSCQKLNLSQTLQEKHDFTEQRERLDFLQELVPPCLSKIPLFLSPPDDRYYVLDKQIQTIAQIRRDFLSSLYPWKKYTSIRAVIQTDKKC